MMKKYLERLLSHCSDPYFSPNDPKVLEAARNFAPYYRQAYEELRLRLYEKLGEEDAENLMMKIRNMQ